MRKWLRIGILYAALLCLMACGHKNDPEPGTAGMTSARETSFDIPAAALPGGADENPNSPGGRPTEPPATQPDAPDVVTVVIPEGFTFYQIARRLEANGVCSAADLTSAAQTYQVQSFAVPASPQACYRLEGMLYPDTYEFWRDSDPNIVLRAMLNNYYESSGLPDYDTLILASIIERETRSSGHMAMVSSVFHNRLAQGMPLQADATIAYVEEHIKQDPLVRNPGQYADRYNTYKCPALPEGPICSPSRRAIDAAKNPSQSDYLYYFFGQDETNHYSRTYDEHLAAIKMYGVG